MIFSFDRLTIVIVRERRISLHISTSSSLSLNTIFIGSFLTYPYSHSPSLPPLLLLLLLRLRLRSLTSNDDDDDDETKILSRNLSVKKKWSLSFDRSYLEEKRTDVISVKDNESSFEEHLHWRHLFLSFLFQIWYLLQKMFWLICLISLTVIPSVRSNSHCPTNVNLCWFDVNKMIDWWNVFILGDMYWKRDMLSNFDRFMGMLSDGRWNLLWWWNSLLSIQFNLFTQWKLFIQFINNSFICIYPWTRNKRFSLLFSFRSFRKDFHWNWKVSNVQVHPFFFFINIKQKSLIHSL